jgi:hypothetical protein
MPVKDVYGKEVSEQNHMVLAHNPISMLINELKRNKNMSDREIMDSKFYGMKENHDVINPDLVHLLGPKIKFQKDFKHMPNQRRHKIVSFIKSGVRIFGYLLIPFSLPLAAGILVLSEIIGIIEELV